MALWADQLPEQVSKGLDTQRHGDLPDWLAHLKSLPDIQADQHDFSSQVRLEKNHMTREEASTLETSMRGLIPWRKGPYQVFDLKIDTEWRSDWKWDRVLPHIGSLESQTVLDVGCGNGYHMWRMLGAGASKVIGIDPSPRFSVQFEMIKQLAGKKWPIHLVPCALEDVPRPLEQFDSTFSMGVLYHRKSPIDHLYELRDSLKPGGQLILETLVIAGDETRCLVPRERYAKMRNVWFIPSSKMLETWLKRLGFRNVRIVDETPTTTDEQRATDWMRFESLPDFLAPEDPSKTIEGYPAPLRATLVANKAPY